MINISENIPFIRVNHLGKDRKIMTNIFGENIVLQNEEFDDYISGNISTKYGLFKELKEKYFFKEVDYIQKSIIEYQKRNWINYIGPTLHIIILTKGCNHQCIYCHASADYRYVDGSLNIKKGDAEKIVDIILTSPNKDITIEFQGGEPTINIDTIDFIINYTEERNKQTKKNINYALVSNLTLLNDEILKRFFIYPNFSISTSLDGDKKIHDFNRLLIGNIKGVSSFEVLKSSILKIRKEEINNGKKILFGAMGVITKKTLNHYKELVDIYVELGFNSIFLKKLNNIGFGEKSKSFLGYTMEELKEFYINYYNYLIEIYKKGIFIKDGFLSICMGKIIKPEITNFMDLRSPCGAGIGQVAYDYTGKIYTCDEGRMIEGDIFKIGTVRDSLEDIIQNEIVGTMMDASIVESLPCDICAYAPYCGVCPIESYQSRGNIYTNQVFDEHCSFFMFIFDWIFKILSKKNTIEYDFLMKHINKNSDN